MTERQRAAQIAYQIHQGSQGPSSRPPIVLIHGAGGNLEQWPPEVRRLAGMTVYALDLPGHAQSQGEGQTSIAGYQGRLIEWLDSLSIERAVWIGHSMGGAISLWAALERPERVAGLVLVGTGARLRVHPRILELTSTASSLSEAVDLIIDWSFGPAASDELVSRARAQMAETRAPVLHGDFLACDAFDVMERIEEIKHPSLVLCGRQDRLTPPKFSQFLSERIPSASLEWIEQAGHMVMLEQPERVAVGVQRFMADHFPPS